MKRERQGERGSLKEGALYGAFVHCEGVHNLAMCYRTEPRVKFEVNFISLRHPDALDFNLSPVSF